MPNLDHLSLAVADLEAAMAFFSEGFGFRVQFVEWGMTDQIASMLGLAGASCDIAQMALDEGEIKLELIAFRHEQAGRAPAFPAAPGMGHIALKVEDFDECLDKLRRLGAGLLGEITEFSAGRAVYLTTPFGAFLELQEARAPQHVPHADRKP